MITIAKLVTIAARSVRALLLAATLAFGTFSVVQADSSAQVVETSPSTSATLHRNQTFWVRIQYETDEPLRLWARPFRNGAPVETATSHPSLTYTGAGEALGWFALRESGDVDEVRVVPGVGARELSGGGRDGSRPEDDVAIDAMCAYIHIKY